MPFSAPSAARLERRVDLFDRGRPLHLEHAVGERGVQQRHAHREAGQLAQQFRVDQRDRRRRAGAGRDQRQAAGAGAAQVLVRRVHDDLRVGDVVDRRDDAVADADGLVDHLDHRRQAVRRARRGGEQVMRAGSYR